MSENKNIDHKALQSYKRNNSPMGEGQEARDTSIISYAPYK